jgi:rSAM/selenodomain-associated transferase 2/rSAM/selenodomain-associated transferase 1
MAKAPDPGRVKTRLQPAFTPAECAELQRLLIRRTVEWAERVAPGAVYVAHDPPEGWGRMVALSPHARPVPQRGAHLGERLAHAVDAVFDRHQGPLLIVGVDTLLTTDHAAGALDHLTANQADVVFGPARDGGYYLLGINGRPPPALFGLPPEGWGGPNVLDGSLRAAKAAGLTKVALLPTERDLDTPADANALLATGELELEPELKRVLRRRLVSVVVPTLNENTELPRLLNHLAALPGRFETIVADGGSTDGTPGIAAAHPLEPTVVTSPTPGRAAQLNLGAERAHGDPIVFLHADTRLPSTAHADLTTTTAEGGNFAIRFDGGDRFSRLLGAWYRVQRRTGVYYGDSAIWLKRRTFDELQGFRPLPIMEDYDLARRLRRAKKETACLPGPVTTSARRWRRLGIPRTVLSWVAIRWLFVAGAPPERLAHLYRRAR